MDTILPLATTKYREIAGLTVGFLTWQVGFMSVGGEWFGMGMSETWNGVTDAF
jgi:predicted small integral membrane protein